MVENPEPRPRFHRLAVKVKRRGLTVRCRKGFFGHQRRGPGGLGSPAGGSLGRFGYLLFW